MKAVKIFFIENSKNKKLIEHSFKTIFSIIGLPVLFINDLSIADIVYDFESPASPVRLFIRRERLDFKPIVNYNVIQNITFLRFDNITDGNFIEQHCNSVCIYNDIVKTTIYFLSGYNDNLISRDKKDFHNIEESFMYKNRLHQTPIINQYANYIKQIFNSNEPLEMWPDKKKYAVALTHDIDYPEMIPWIESLRYVWQNKAKANPREFIKVLSGKSSFWLFKDYVDLEAKYNFKSAFYFCGYKGNLLRYLTIAPDTFYDITKDNFKSVMNYLDSSGCEIGMHSSYFAYQSGDQFEKEKKQVEQSLGKRITGNRHHYWHLNQDNIVETVNIHQKIGLEYDSSIAYEKISGFRYSICSPYYLFDQEKQAALSVLQLPPTLMDDQLFGHSKYSYFKNPEKEIDHLLESVKKYNGLFMVDYHDRVLNETFFPGFGKSYKHLLERVHADHEIYCDTPQNICNWWKKREKILNEYNHI